MPKRDIVVIGASAGGVEALLQFVPRLPADLPAALFVVIHFPPGGKSVLPAILARSTRLNVKQATDGARIKEGTIYVARPDYHLLVDDKEMRLMAGPRENRARPAIDPLFRSAARAFGPRVVGVLLSGALDDGVAGLGAIQRTGGLTMVQDPHDALCSQMPRSALEYLKPDVVASAEELGRWLAKQAGKTIAPPKKRGGNGAVDLEMQATEMKESAMRNEHKNGKPSVYGCPECHGALWEIEDGDHLLRFRCRVGHGYTAAALLEEESTATESALWAALRSLEETHSLSKRMAAKARARKHKLAERRFSERAEEAAGHAKVLRKLLASGTTRPLEPEVGA